MAKVLVTGATGQVGRELLKLASHSIEVVGFSSAELDITDYQSVQQLVAEEAPDLIINAAAYTAVDKAESDVEQARAVNEMGIKNLAEAAASLKIPVFHISTDYVFDGQSPVPYKETDSVAPEGVYGATKLAGEQVLANSGINHIILRTSWVFGAEGNNFVKTMLRLGKERDTLGVVADQQGCPTSAASIAKVLWLMAQRYIKTGTLEWGIYHFSNAPACTWHDFACEIFQQAVAQGMLTKAPVVSPITTDDYPTPAKRPANSVLNCSKLTDYLSIELPDWREELRDVLGQLQQQQNQGA
jgi:dTDP-4-dehydrorhamnose reductase